METHAECEIQPPPPTKKKINKTTCARAGHSQLEIAGGNWCKVGRHGVVGGRMKACPWRTTGSLLRPQGDPAARPSEDETELPDLATTAMRADHREQ